jgi:hypothetical protein
MPEATGGAAAAPDPVLQRFIELVQRAEAEGNAVLPEVRAFLDDHPDLWRRFGDLAASAKLAMIDVAVGGQPVLKEATVRQATELENDLAGAHASPLEKVLASHVAASWLAVAEARTTAANARSASLPQAEYLDRRRDRAGQRLESAAKTLALVRKLILPAPAPIEVATRTAGVSGRASARQGAQALQAAGVEN